MLDIPIEDLEETFLIYAYRLRRPKASYTTTLYHGSE